MVEKETALILKTCSIDMVFDPETLPQALELLRAAVGPIQVKRGCCGCSVELDATETGLVHYREEWESERGFERHVRSDEFWPILVAMDLSAKKPRACVGDLSARQGLEALLALREPGTGVGDASPEVARRKYL